MTAILRLVILAALIGPGHGLASGATDGVASPPAVATPAGSDDVRDGAAPAGCGAAELADSGSTFCQTCDCAVETCRDSCAKCR